MLLAPDERASCFSCDGEGKAVLSSCPGLSFSAAFKSLKLGRGRRVMSQGKYPQSSGAAAEPEYMFVPETISISGFSPSFPREISPGSQDRNVDVFLSSRWLCNTSIDARTRKWAVEGLAYLTLDADVKDDFVEDEPALQAMFELAKVCLLTMFPHFSGSIKFSQPNTVSPGRRSCDPNPSPLV